MDLEGIEEGDCLAVESLAGASNCGLDSNTGSEGLNDGVERECGSSSARRSLAVKDLDFSDATCPH